MRTLCVGLILSLGFAAASVAGHSGDSSVSTRHIEAERIILKSPNGRHTVTISATDKGAGVWIHDAEEHSRSICIYNLEKEGTAIGLHGPGKTPGFRAALFIDGSEGRVQLSDGKYFRHLNP